MNVTEAERFYYQVEMPKVRKAVEAFKAEMGDTGRCITYRALHERLEEVEGTIRRRHERYLEAFKEDLSYENRAFIASDLPRLEEEARKLRHRMKLLMTPPKKGSGITEDMIDRAREYPLSQLVEVDRRGFARCVAHEDRNPSMFAKGNFAHCFSCGYSGDVIDVAMRILNLDFPEAVRRLQ